MRNRAYPFAVSSGVYDVPLCELYESDEAHALAAPPSAAELLTLVDRVIRFARVGIEGAL